MFAGRAQLDRRRGSGRSVGLPDEGVGAVVAGVLAGIGGGHGDPTAGQRNT